MAVDIDAWLERIGGFLTGAFGGRFAVGMLIGLMDDITPFQCYESIKENKDLFPGLTEEDWQKVRQFITRAGIEEIDLVTIRKQFQRRRPDLLSVIINHPNGEDWLNNQVIRLRAKLGLEE